jgi:hypothetical protein
MNAGNVAHVALDLRFREVPVPRTPPGRCSPCERSRIAAGNDALGERSAERLIASFGVG